MSLLAYAVDTLIFINIYAILALSLNLEAGTARLMNFGKVAFFAIGAYASALLSLTGLPFPASLLGGAVLAGVAGVAVALPALRLREDYLAIATIAFGEIIRLILLNERWLTSGPVGLRGIPQPMRDAVQEYQLFYLALTALFLVGVAAFLQVLTWAPFGRVLRAIREDELVAQALGKHTFSFKARAFALASALAGIAGALFAHYLTFISPDMFMPAVTFSVWTMIVVGGRGSVPGAVAGAAMVVMLERGTRLLKDYTALGVEPSNLRMILLGLMLILFLMYRPQGLIREKKYEVGG